MGWGCMLAWRESDGVGLHVGMVQARASGAAPVRMCPCAPNAREGLEDVCCSGRTIWTRDWTDRVERGKLGWGEVGWAAAAA
eukprot:363481-Chlamydomonas_euryale.AAC.7